MISVLSVFWFHNDKFYGEDAVLDSNKVIAFGDYMQIDADHYLIWDKYRKEMKLPSYVEYDRIPRGRILFHIPTHHFIVIGSKSIVSDLNVQEKLLRWFGLPTNTEFRWDEHYC